MSYEPLAFEGVSALSTFTEEATVATLISSL